MAQLPTANSQQPFNIAQFLPQMAKQAPGRPAIVCRHAPDELGRTALSFAELDRESDRLAWGLAETGAVAGARTLLMLRPGLDFIALTFALFKAGAVPVLIDPGMGWRNLQNCVRQCRPELCIAVPLAHAFRVLAGNAAFDSVRLHVTAGRRWFWGGMTVRELRRLGADKPFPLAPTTEASPAAILFTSGGTGIPKGVLYAHGMFGAQVAAIRAEYGIQAGERDLPAFPLFGLFAPALGTTCVIPELNPSRPAQCDPAKIVNGINSNQITYTFGSPAIWRRVGPYCIAKGITFPTVRRILMAGAPVRAEVLEPFTQILPNGDTYIPYGATEALPVASIRGSEVLRDTWALTLQGKGYCVGRPLPGVTVKVIACEPAVREGENWDDSLLLPPGEIGEIVVQGAVVTQEYFELPEQTRRAKLQCATGLGPYPDPCPRTREVPEQAAIRADASSPVPDPRPPAPAWHRMGDMGYFDAAGRLWFCGRKVHRVIVSNEKILYSVCVEAVFENFLRPFMTKRDSAQQGLRVALAGVGEPQHRRGVVIVEAPAGPSPRELRAIAPELERWAAREPLARDIAGILLYRKPFPVDVRHNAKIDREQLGRWAETQREFAWEQ